MKLSFFNTGLPHLGVNRIYIENLSKWLKPHLSKVTVTDEISDLPNYDICIFSKYSKLEEILELRKLSDTTKVGIIHPSDLNYDGRKKMQIADFFIVGSIEEQDYYLRYSNNVFRFPQIEDIKLNEYRLHKKKDQIILGYHGNLEHLQECSKSFKYAIEDASDKINLKLHVMYNLKLGKWKKNRPNVDIEFFDWDFESLINKMSMVDIGLMPCINKNILDVHLSDSNFFLKNLKLLLTKSGRKNDYSLNFKNTANAGRSFVFHQLKVPVIADFWPSNFEILSNPICGRLAHSYEGWYKNIIELSESHDLRQEISDNAFEKFNELYDQKKWTVLFLNFLNKL